MSVVTVILFPASAFTNIPFDGNVANTSSPVTTPFKMPPRTVASVVASYVLFCALRPVTVKSLGLIFKVALRTRSL